MTSAIYSRIVFWPSKRLTNLHCDFEALSDSSDNIFSRDWSVLEVHLGRVGAFDAHFLLWRTYEESKKINIKLLLNTCYLN